MASRQAPPRGDGNGNSRAAAGNSPEVYDCLTPEFYPYPALLARGAAAVPAIDLEAASAFLVRPTLSAAPLIAGILATDSSGRSTRATRWRPFSIESLKCRKTTTDARRDMQAFVNRLVRGWIRSFDYLASVDQTSIRPTAQGSGELFSDSRCLVH